jgi:hypothetical protein
MKYIFAVFIFVSLMAQVVCAQIMLEHVYPFTPSPPHLITLVEVDSALWRYIITDETKTISVYDLNHILEKEITIPPVPDVSGDALHLFFFSKRLFGIDEHYEYLIMGYTNAKSTLPFVRIFNDQGDTLFSCDTCYPNTPLSENSSFEEVGNAIVNTSAGTKLLITRANSGNHEVYSLPGKLVNTNHNNVQPNKIETSGSTPVANAYPNPSNGPIRIEYSLPQNITSGELVITNVQGIEIRRYKIGSMFSDILISRSELPVGAYYYQIVTSQGESDVKSLVVVR